MHIILVVPFFYNQICLGLPLSLFPVHRNTVQAVSENKTLVHPMSAENLWEKHLHTVSIPTHGKLITSCMLSDYSIVTIIVTIHHNASINTFYLEKIAFRTIDQTKVSLVLLPY